MDVKKVINNRIFLSSTKSGSFDYSTSISSNIQQFYEKDDECNYLLFEYFIYKIIQFKLKNNILINSDIIIISEDFLNNNEKIIKERIDTYTGKLLLIPIYDNPTNKWGLIILPNLFTEEKNIELIAKLIISNKNSKNFENILDNIVRKIKINFKNEEKIKYKIDILDIGCTVNSSKFVLNLINKLLEPKKENLDEYINNLFNCKKNREMNSIKNCNNDGKSLIEEINSNNEFFKDLFKKYSIEYNEFMKNKNLIENSDDNFDFKIEDEDNNKKGNEITIDKPKKFKEKLDKKANEEINSKNNDKKNKKKEQDEIDKLAKNVVNNIMNLPIYMEKESVNSHKEKNLCIPEKKPQNLIIYDTLSKKTNKNKNDICDIEFEDTKDDNPNEIANNSADDIFDLNFNCMNDNKCENKKIDEVTKSTIDDILDSVLKDMKINKKKEKKISKKACKNIKKFKNFRLRALNIDPKFEIIKEEDKESSTSEMVKEMKSNNNMNEDEKNTLNESILRFSLKIENSFEYEKRLSSHSIKKNCDKDKKREEKKLKKKNPKIEKENENNERKVEKFNLRKPNINNMLLKNRKSQSKKDYKRNINQNNKEANNLKLNKIQNRSKSKIEKKEENNINKFTKEEININANHINNDKIKITKNNNTIDNSNKSINQNENNFPNVNSNPNNYTSKANTNKNLNDLNKGNDDSTFNKNNCPRDNNRRRYTVQTSKLDIHPDFLLKNGINNDTNSVQKNGINSQNIIIINNTVHTHKNQKSKNQIKKEDKKIFPKKGPEDIKVPKDNRNKKKNNNEIIKKVPCDAIKPDIKILIKEAIKNNEAKYDTKTIKIKKSNSNINNNNKNDSLSRTHSGIENSRKNINDIYDEDDNFRAHSSHNINIIKNLGLNFEANQTNIDTKQFISFNFTNRNENLELNKQGKIYSDKEVNRKTKFKNILKDKNYIIKNNNNSSKIVSNNKTLDFIKPKIGEQERKIQENPQKNNNIFNKKEEKYNNKNDICILY